jgi:hypothetical protein
MKNIEYPDYEGMKSVCCGAEVIEGTMDICGSCQDHTGFEPDEDDDTDNEYKTIVTTYATKINEMRAEYLREKYIDKYIDNRRDSLLEQADYLKKQMKEN